MSCLFLLRKLRMETDASLGTPPHALRVAVADRFPHSCHLHECADRSIPPPAVTENSLARCVSGVGLPCWSAVTRKRSRFKRVAEEATHSHSAVTGLVDPLVRADVVFYEVAGGGAVFATGSIAWGEHAVSIVCTAPFWLRFPYATPVLGPEILRVETAPQVGRCHPGATTTPWRASPPMWCGASPTRRPSSRRTNRGCEECECMRH
jgi:hypothetical protein